MCISALVFPSIRSNLQKSSGLQRNQSTVNDTHNMFPAPRTICHDHVGCTSFRVGWVKAHVVDCTNCYRVDTIRVTVEIALVFMPSTVAACENV